MLGRRSSPLLAACRRSLFGSMAQVAPQQITSIGDIIAQANGQPWHHRYNFVRAIQASGRLCVGDGTDLVGVNNYANFSAMDANEHGKLDIIFHGGNDQTLTNGRGGANGNDQNTQSTFYEFVNLWQANFARAICDLDGTLKAVQPLCYSDEHMFADFYAARPKGLVILDVGCNTGLNLRRALRYSGGFTSSGHAFGIEYSVDSASLAKGVFGDEAIVQGDSAGDFIVQKKWNGKFDVAHFTAVAQHLTPSNLKKTLRNIALGLKSPTSGVTGQTGGELLMTFKDAPTVKQLKAKGMEAWASEIFTADQAAAYVGEDTSPTDVSDDPIHSSETTKSEKVSHGPMESYLSQGYLTAVMWDDDYYLGVVGNLKIDAPRLPNLRGSHERKFNFYSLDFMKALALECGLVAESVEMHPDSKIPLSAAHWRVIFRKTT